MSPTPSPAPGQWAPTDVVGVLLVRADGALLLQHRDEHAAIAPEQWGMVGGRQEPDEEPLAAALRELAEETGLTPEEPLRPWWSGVRPASAGPGETRWHVYAARTTVTDADVVLGEGRAIVFVAPDRVAALDLGPSARYFLPRFLADPLYAALQQP